MRRILSAIACLWIIPILTPSSLCASGQTTDHTGVNQPVTQRQIQVLKEQIYNADRSSVEGIFSYHTQNGDLNTQLNYWTAGGQLNYKWTPWTMLYFRATRTSFMTRRNFLDEQGTNLTGGIKASLSDMLSLQVEGGATNFSTGGTTLNGFGSLRFKMTDGTILHLTASRSNVTETLLSAAGIRPSTGPFAGEVVGQVMDNQVMAGVQHRLSDRFDVYGEGGVGVRTGKHIESNFFKQVDGGVDYTVFSNLPDQPINMLRLSYAADYFGFDKDLYGFGGASLLNRVGLPSSPAFLGSDGISPIPGPGNPGLGGYFSPQYFLSNVGRAELGGRPLSLIEYHVSGFLGGQSFTGTGLHKAEGYSGNVTVHLGALLSIPVTYVHDNFGPYTEQTLFVTVVARF